MIIAVVLVIVVFLAQDISEAAQIIDQFFTDKPPYSLSNLSI